MCLPKLFGQGRARAVYTRLVDCITQGKTGDYTRYVEGFGRKSDSDCVNLFRLRLHAVEPIREHFQALLLHVAIDEECSRAGEFDLALHQRATVRLSQKFKAVLDGDS